MKEVDGGGGEEVEFLTTVTKLPSVEYPEQLAPPQPRRLVDRFEAAFFRLGSFTADRPAPVIIGCLIFTAIGCAGLPFMKTENNAIKLWIPQTSDFSLNYAWLWNHFPPELRQHSIILHSHDVLTPESIQKMYQIYKDVYAIQTDSNRTWEESCLRVPVVNIDKLIEEELGARRKRRASEEDEWGAFNDEFQETSFSEHTDMSVDNYPEPYCGKVSDLQTQCYQESLLELWAVDGHFGEASDSSIAALTKEQILHKVNTASYSEFYMREKDFLPLLGGVERGGDGKIISARATTMMWIGKMDAVQALQEGGKDDAATGELVDSETNMFETKLTQVLLGSRDISPQNLQVEVNVANSFGDIASSTIWGDVSYLILGFSIVFLYVNVMLGKFNVVEQRGYLSLIGLASVGMSIGFSYGFCSLCGLSFGPLHNIIPFLLLGIGIDDMFVSMQCFNNLSPTDSHRSLRDRFGVTMSRAGCAITVTSITDFLAFAIGGTTVLPALKSFCLFCAVGLIVVYLLQATWFIAWFSIDQRRIEAGRNGSLVCYTHTNFQPNKLSQKNILQSVFKSIAKAVIRWPARIAIILASLTLLGVSIWGNVLLRQEFNPVWFLPADSYLAQWHHHNSQLFPSQGEQVTVFLAGLQLPEELPKLDLIHSKLQKQSDIIASSSLDSWYLDFKKYVNNNFHAEVPEKEMEVDEFNMRLTQFLFSPSGSKHRLLLNFNESLVCGDPASKMELATISFTHHLMEGPKQQIPAMNRVKDILTNANFSSKVFPMCKGYASWETDEVISEELYRNICLAILCVFITTWILLFNLWASLLVLGCVVLTLVNVGGFIHFWGLTIDTVSCTNIIISIGLCVDYSAHVAHAFMSSTGTRAERVNKALAEIGPAVFNGGFSTFLAFVLLAGSKSHVFATFFKVFFLVVIFGLFNGLLLLPVVLSLIGPTSYSESAQEKTKEVPEESEPFKPIIKNGAGKPEN